MLGLTKRERLSRKLEEKQLEKQLQVLESIPNWAKDADDGTWFDFGSDGYSENDLSDMRGKMRQLYDTNPMAKNIIESIVDFVIGKKCTIKSVDPVAQDYWDEFYVLNDFDERSKEIARRTLLDGEQFLQIFFMNTPRIRAIEPKEIKSDKYSYGIETNPEDVEDVIAYHREWEDEKGMQHSQRIKADNIIHSKIGVNKNVKRGVSFLTGSAKYLVDYQNWLQDRVNLNKLRSYFMVIGNVKGAGAASNLGSKFNDSTKTASSGSTTSVNKKRQFKSGSVMSSKGVDWDLKSLNINASDTKDDGRALRLMVTSGTRLTEYVVTGDSSNANYASTMVSESPMVKGFESWQDYFEKVFKKIYTKVTEHGLRIGKIPTSYTNKEGKQTETGTDCEVVFPILIHRDPKADTEALTLQRNAGWVSDETCSEKLGYDYEEEQKRIDESETTMKNKEVEEMIHSHEY